MADPTGRGAPAQAGGEPGDDLLRIAGVVRGRAWLVAFCLALALLGGVLHLRHAQPLYSATATIKFEPRDVGIVGQENLQTANSNLRDIETQLELIRSPRVAAAVAESLGLDAAKEQAEQPGSGPIGALGARLAGSWKFLARSLVTYEPVDLDPELRRQQAVVKRLLEGLEVRRRLDTRIIRITATDADAEMSARLANEFAAQYALSLSRDQAEAYQYARGQLTRQLADSRARLEAAERELFEFAAGPTEPQEPPATPAGIDAAPDLRILDQNLDISIATMRLLTEQIETTKNDIALYSAENSAAKVEAIKQLLLRTDTGYAKLEDRVQELELERISLAADNEPAYPPLRKVERELEFLRAEMRTLETNVLGESEGRLALARFKLTALEQRLAEQEERAAAIQRRRVDYTVLQRGVESERALYGALLDRSKQLDIKQEVEPSNVTLVGRAMIPGEPAYPRIGNTLLVAALLGLGAGIVLALGMHWLDRSVYDPATVERRMGLPSLGMVPFLGRLRKGAAKGRTGLLITSPGTSPLEADAFRFVRTSLQYASAGRPPRAILVTSALAQEGKSTVAANIAIAFAEAGRRVLLIDGDLKAPSVHRVFGIDKTPGLTDVLTGQREFADAIQQAPDAPSLQILPAGPQAPSPVDLLDSAAMDRVLEAARAKYDLVVVDAAPCQAMADALVLARRVDGVCIVVNHGKTDIELLEKTVAALERVGAHLFGAVYNSRSKYRRGPRYGYGFGYGEGYGTDAASAKG
ncbi:MAG: polysaccharide biosynthesis tyrosine autokinase [Candidatus Sumerlaeia bacterium]|nr:polysaccharide biosynthesis tyrosine autokinase [Candidatus Sumerlaeia bacterium]